jgi:RNA polymerase primary sigma factor
MTTVAQQTHKPMQKQGIFIGQRSLELNDEMVWYIDQLRHYPLLSKEQEVELAKRIEAGDEQARTELIQGNLRLVVSIARYYQRGQVSLHDLIQEGNIGLMRATQTFDWRKGYKFSTFATYWIRQAITRVLPELEYPIHIPCYNIDKRNKLKRASIQFTMHYGYEPSMEELAEFAGETLENVLTVWQHMSYMLSLDAPAENYEDGILADFIEDPQATSEIDYEQDEISERVTQALSCLSKREQQIIKLRFGIGEQGRKAPLQEIGKMLGITRERVRQIEAIAMKKLKKALLEEEEKHARRITIPVT